MGCGKSILITLRALALIVALGVTGLGGWSIFTIRDIQARSDAILDSVEFGSQEMEQLWARFFDAVIAGAIRTWVSIGLTALASLIGIVLVLATILPPIRIRSAIMVPLECLGMCAMGAAVGISLSFALSVNAFGERVLDISASPELRRLAMLVDLSMIHFIAAGAGWLLFLIAFISATVDACRRAREKESCSFEPTASALGISHGYATTFPPQSPYRMPSIYDQEAALNANDATASAWNISQAKESVGRDPGMSSAESIVSQEGRLSIGSEMSSISGPLGLQKPERVQPARPARPSRPWSGASSIRSGVVHAI
ncbi:hypothetical protein COCC4DRAFT_197545 [Bipolaris maydis ATCC 48331]|uniref:Uncharacterized protein n=2 Tax=Cochliobolus heterostrophus TaxID=5016 RepID=M2TIX9_COCH5|nr:uncharacterized protein COCC4DRAFT_197545 [Bipolaris maydis ATCC 48331]EMD97365.1 hypothetical protein COCHEDRAFT_1220800 [Bipolaris maydis C5]KAJ5029781.1 hypothetical protein J3E73DRAFT_379642 [Bipolaris maydis]ENI04179.1 hypothetical protein COCC4DRAFT_197545 [Bipolaris maydis ATCC 48331]KAJ5055192.1 hypothetical protein J3E74DRAFT_422500 [Bipolaris maydis]KAJ5061458.1 hypothetical protein J3E74DRAFT_266858 [Bipolaris maydis]